jgi:hypothetical protein
MMKRSQVNFFASKSDLEFLQQGIETKHRLQFVEAGLFDVVLQTRTETLLGPNFGIALKGDGNHEITYLVADLATAIQVRAVPQHKGGVKYAIDQQMNPGTIVFRPGGTYGENVLIAGFVGTISDAASSLAIFQLFKREINAQFKGIKSFLVGREAAVLLQKGWRLMNNVESPSLYDLKS